MKKEFKIFLILLLVYILIFLTPLNSVNAEEGTTKEIDIMLTPDTIFFDLTNLKPGDWSQKTLIITNSGKEDFEYIVSSKRKAGSKELYEALLLTIEDSRGEVFSGELGEFNTLNNRFIASSKSEELKFTIQFPKELGNEYQGLITEVEFKFYAEGTLGGLLPVDGPKLPDTAVGYLRLLIAGGLCVGGGAILLKIRNKIG